MVTNFSAPSGAPPAAAQGGSGGKTLLVIAGLAVVAYCVYRFIIKPAKEEKEAKK